MWGWTHCFGLVIVEDFWLAVSNSRWRNNKPGNGETSSYNLKWPHYVDFPIGLPDELSWLRPGGYFRDSLSERLSHALPNFRTTETQNQCSAIIKRAWLVTGTEKEPVAHGFPSPWEQCLHFFLSCTILHPLLLFWCNKLYSSTSLFLKMHLPLYLAIFQ